MSETVIQALIGASSAVITASIAAYAQIKVKVPETNNAQRSPQTHASEYARNKNNNQAKRKERTGLIALFFGAVALMLVAVGIFRFVALSEQFKNGVLVAAAVMIAALIITLKEPKDMSIMPTKRPTFTLLIIVVITGALLDIGISKAREVIEGPPPLSAPVCLANNFYPSGYMGDGEGENRKGTDPIDLNDQWTQNCHSDPTCIRIVYHPTSNKWAGVYWQYPDSNWGDEPGRKILGAKKLVFWARGDRGNEVVSFKVGGINKKKYKDSLEKSLGPLKLATEWQYHEIDLSDADTSSIIGAFAWVASAKGNPDGLTFYLEGICFTK